MAKAAATALTADERADAREARKADNRARHRAKLGAAGSETPEFAGEQAKSLDAFLQSLGASDQGVSVVVLQVAPQRHGELGGPSHILEQPYAPTLREADLKELARQSGCADSGTFELRVVRTTEKGTKIVQVFRRQWRWKPDPTVPAATDPLTDVDRFARTAAALKSLSGMAAIDAAMINALKPQSYQPPPTNPVMDDVFKALIARALAPPEDPIARMSAAVALIDQTRGPVAPPTNPMDTLNGLGTTLTALKALAGSLGPEAPASSPWIEVLRLAAGALAPLAAQIPAMWQMAQAQRGQELEVKKRETLAVYVRVGVPLPLAAQLAGVALPQSALGAITPGRHESATPESTVATGGSSAGPFGRFFGAIVEGDASAFPAIAETIMAFPNGVGAKILDALATDPNALAVIRGQIEAQGTRAFFGELFIDGSDAFFGRFAAWWRAQNTAGQEGAS